MFVCRYAFSTLSLHEKSFACKQSLWKSSSFRNTQFKEWVTRTSEFQFGMSDIARLREEIATLIDRLSQQYRNKQELKRQKKVRREKDEKKFENGNELELKL